MLYALQYINSIGGIVALEKHEQELTKYFLEKVEKIHRKDDGMGGDACNASLQIIGPMDPKKRVGVFSFVLPHMKNFQLVGEKFAEKDIAIRCGGHCAYPLHKALDVQ